MRIRARGTQDKWITGHVETASRNGRSVGVMLESGTMDGCAALVLNVDYETGIITDIFSEQPYEVEIIVVSLA